MHIQFKEIELHNFMSFGHSILAFNDDGFIRVTGINENPEDNAVSNGAGKSSLWEGVIWALTGDTIRGTKQVGNLYGEDGTYVSLLFKLDNDTYHITRSKDHKELKTSLQIWINGTDRSGKGIRESEKLLSQYLPDLTASLLGSVIILGQGLPQRFTSNTPSGRKEVLEKLSKSYFMIEDLKSKVLKRKIELSNLIRTYQDTIVSITSKQSILTTQIESSKAKLGTLDKSSLEQKLTLVTDSQLKIQQRLSEINTVLLELNTKREELTTYQQAIFNRHQTSLLELESKYSDDLNKYQTQYNELKAKITTLNSEISRIQNIKDTCPTCGQKLIGVTKPDAEPYIIELKPLNDELNTIEALITTIKNNKENDRKKLIDDYNLSNNINKTDLEKVKLQISVLCKEQTDLQSDLGAIQSELNNLHSSIASIDATIENLNLIICDNQRELETLSQELVYNNLEKDLQQSHLEVINKFDTALKRDFRGYLLSNIINYIQFRAKEYCKVIFETDKIEFQLNGNNIDITYLDKVYENLSGGERQRIDLIIQFSIRDMLCNHLGFTSNILVLDEVFDALDMLGCQRVLDVISNVTDIKNIFIVTHRKDLSIPCDKELLVVKSAKGISEIK